MLGSIRHRGPDEFGIYQAPQAALASARLSIIDLSGGQQPISNEDGSLWIVFNGEIFNYLELRRDLEARGHRLATNTDTEVVLHLFEDLGPDCLRQLNGQFAIAIWDKKRKQLFLARDRVGVRPLFYTRINNALVFASEIKALLEYPGVSAEMDPGALREVFTYWSTLSPRTCFNGIFELPPGSFLTASPGAAPEVRAWWELDFQEDSPSRTLEDYLDEFRALLRDATRLRLRADVPVGAYLSGGLDSSTIAALVRESGVGHLDTFSISFSDPHFDESVYQKQMATLLGTEHQVVHATYEDIGEAFPEVVWHTEAPLLRTAPAPMFLLSKLVRDQKYKVVLTGEGADEFLAGYDIFKEAKIRRFWADQPKSKFRSLPLKRIYPDIQAFRETNIAYLSAFFGRGLTDTHSRSYSHFLRWQNGQRLCRFLADQPGANTAVSEPRYPDAFNAWGDLQRAQFLEISIFLSQYLLSSQGDRVAMAHSVEGRYPFLDERVIRFCNRLPARFKLRALKDKFLLRRAAEGLLPRTISARPKRPYRAPIRKCFFNDSQSAYVNEVLSSSAVSEAGLFKPAAVEQLVRKAREGSTLGETDEMGLVGIISSQLLYHQFVRNHRPSRPIGNRDNVKFVRQAQE